MTRSAINLRSNSATLPRTSKTSLPVAVVVPAPQKQTPPELVALAAELKRWLGGTADERLQLREALGEELELLKKL